MIGPRRRAAAFALALVALALAAAPAVSAQTLYGTLVVMVTQPTDRAVLAAKIVAVQSLKWSRNLIWLRRRTHDWTAQESRSVCTRLGGVGAGRGAGRFGTNVIWHARGHGNAANR